MALYRIGPLRRCCGARACTGDTLLAADGTAVALHSPVVAGCAVGPCPTVASAAGAVLLPDAVVASDGIADGIESGAADGIVDAEPDGGIVAAPDGGVADGIESGAADGIVDAAPDGGRPGGIVDGATDGIESGAAAGIVDVGKGVVDNVGKGVGTAVNKPAVGMQRGRGERRGWERSEAQGRGGVVCGKARGSARGALRV